MSDITEETPKKTIAKKVVTEKRKYFSPTHGEIEAASLDEVASKIAKIEEKLNEKEVKVGDVR